MVARLFSADLKLTSHQITAVGSRADETAASFASDFGIATAHGSYAALVADPSVDIVYVATPHIYHHAHASVALRAGKHVLVEKPITVNAAEANDLARLAEDRQLLLLEAMWTRWLPHMVATRELVRDGAIGEVRTLLVDHAHRLTADPKHRLNSLELGGGALLDRGVYPLSFASSLFGPPSSLHAEATLASTGVDAETSIVLSHAAGRRSVIHTAINTPGPNRAVILGTEGRIEIDPVWHTATSIHLYNSRGELVSTLKPEVAGRGMQLQADEAERLILTGITRSEVMPISESISVMSTMDEVRRQIGLRYPAE